MRADILDRRVVRRAHARASSACSTSPGRPSSTPPRERLFALNVEGTRIVLEEALRAGVRARRATPPRWPRSAPRRPGAAPTRATSGTPGATAIPYLDAKHEAEVDGAAAASPRGLPLVIVNPAHVLGPGDPGRSSTTLVRRFLRRQIPAYVDGTLNIVGVEDVARGHLLADERGAVGRALHPRQPQLHLDRLFADLGRLSGVEPPAVKLPLAVALALAGRPARRIGADGMPTPIEIRAASLNWAFVNRKAKRELGWQTSPHEDCLEETIAWYRASRGCRAARRVPGGPPAAGAAGRAAGCVRRVRL